MQNCRKKPGEAAEGLTPIGEFRSQNSETRMQNCRKDLGDRLLDFAADVIALSVRLQRSPTGRYLVGQLVRASASAGANFQEARGAESRADFVHKLQVVLKELREAEYWLKLLRRTKLMPADLLTAPLAEADELIRIVVKSVVTAKSRS
jgi:four helix bundle protein